MVAAAAIGTAAVADAQRPTFRAAADTVIVDVSVTANRRPVADLSRADFSLTDNGVPQDIDEVVISAAPIDLELLIDSSRDFGSSLPTVASDATAVRTLLLPGDRSAIATFDSQVHGAGLFDAITTALIPRAEPGRRRVIVVVTTGLYTDRFASAAARREALARSDAPVHIIASGQRRVITDTDALGPLRQIADATGGRCFNLAEGDSFIAPLREALAEFRTRYLLIFRARGVAANGWHALAVTLTRTGDFDVRARVGYWSE